MEAANNSHSFTVAMTTTEITQTISHCSLTPILLVLYILVDSRMEIEAEIMNAKRRILFNLMVCLVPLRMDGHTCARSKKTADIDKKKQLKWNYIRWKCISVLREKERERESRL